MTNLSEDARTANPGILKIIGVGQSLRGDDAAGLEAVRLWEETYQARHDRRDIQVELAELPGIGLLSLIESSRAAILVDAVRGGGEPGTIYRAGEEQISAFESGSGSAHGWGVAETLSLGRQLMPSSMPGRLILIGIEAGQLALGDKLSPAVQNALPEAAELIEQVVLDELARS